MSAKKLSANRLRWKTQSPIVLGIPPAKKEQLKQLPFEACARLEQGIATSGDWRAVCFRLRVGLELALKHYQGEAVQGMHEALTALSLVRQRYHDSGNTLWRATAVELDLLRLGLEAVNTMQDQTLRRDQLPAFYAAEEFMKKNPVL